MTMLFAPAVRNNGQFFPLPQPIRKFQVQDSWDYERFKVPRETGDGTAGVSRNGVDLTIQGEVAIVAGEPVFSEVEMLEALETLRSGLHAEQDEGVEFFLYRDDMNGEYRYFQNCTISRFRYELSQPELYSYSLLVHAGNPVMRTEI